MADIEKGLRSLRDQEGRVTLYEVGDDGWTIIVTGAPGFYGIDVLENESSAEILLNKNGSPTHLIPVFGYEFQGDQVVADIELIVRLVKHLVDTREYLTDDPQIVWEHRDT